HVQRSGADRADRADAAPRGGSREHRGCESDARRGGLLGLPAERAGTLLLARHSTAEPDGGASAVESLAALLRRRERPRPRHPRARARGGRLPEKVALSSRLSALRPARPALRFSL